MKRSELKELIIEIIKEEILSEGLATNVEKELNILISNIKSGKGVDKRAMKNMTDGELLATFLRPVLQSVTMSLNDRKGFYRNFKQN